MATYQKFHVFVKDLNNKVHNFSADSLKLLFTNVAPTSATETKTSLTEIAATGGYSAGGFAIASVSVAMTNGVCSVAGNGIVLSATATVGPFRYAVLYNDTPVSPADPLIGWWDYGSSITPVSAEVVSVTFGSAIFTHT